jgi:hypothetical protein
VSAEQMAALAITASPVLVAMAIHAWMALRQGGRRSTTRPTKGAGERMTS